MRCSEASASVGRMLSTGAALLIVAVATCAGLHHRAAGAPVTTETTEPAELSQAREILRDALARAGAVENHSERAQLLHEIALAQASAGDVPAAIETAGSLAMSDPVREGRLFMEIGRQQARSGDRAGAMATYRRAFELWLANGVTHVGDADCLFAFWGPCFYPQDYVVEAQMPKEALEIAALLPDATEKALMIGLIGAAQIEAGDQAGAAEMLRLALGSAASISDPIAKTKTSAWIEFLRMRERLLAGDLPGAEAIAIAIPDDTNRRHQALVEIARAQAKTGDLSGASRTISLLPPDRQVFERLLAGDLRGAQDIAATIPDDTSGKDFAVTEIARAQAKAGDVPGALRSIASLPQGKPAARNVWIERDEGLKRIATAQAESGDVPDALELAESIQSAFWKDMAVMGIAEVQANAGDTQGALQTLARMKSGFFKASALRENVSSRAKAEDLPRALEVASSIEPPALALRPLVEIAEAQAKFGDCAGAARTVSRVLEAWAVPQEGSAENPSPLNSVVLIQTEIGDVPGALHIAGGLPNATLRAGALEKIAKIQAQAGDPTGALSWVAAQTEPLLGASALLGVAEGLIERVRPSTPFPVQTGADPRRLAIEHCYRR